MNRGYWWHSVPGSKSSKKLILYFPIVMQIVSRDIARNDLAWTSARNKGSPNFRVWRSPVLSWRALISLPLFLLPFFLPLDMHESISCSVACRKSNMHRDRYEHSASRRDLFVRYNFPSLPVFFFFFPHPAIRFLTKWADSVDRALIAPLILAARLPGILIAGFSARQLSCFSTKRTFYFHSLRFSLSMRV